jgi:ABC-type proline/glycine betaine transport system substrate-binding protein
MVCSYYKKPCHLKANCFKLTKKNSGERDSVGTVEGVAGTADVVLSKVSEDFGNDIWIGDSGASCHSCNENVALNHYTINSEEKIVGNGNVMIAEKNQKAMVLDSAEKW